MSVGLLRMRGFGEVNAALHGLGGEVEDGLMGLSGHAVGVGVEVIVGRVGAGEVKNIVLQGIGVLGGLDEGEVGLASLGIRFGWTVHVEEVEAVLFPKG